MWWRDADEMKIVGSVELMLGAFYFYPVVSLVLSLFHFLFFYGFHFIYPRCHFVLESFYFIVFDFVTIGIISLVSLSFSVFLFPLSLSLFVSLLLLLSSSSLLPFEEWFSPRGEIVHSGVSFTSVVMSDEHVCGHCLGDQGHDGVLLEFF
jgi:hypothetical protein